MEAIRAKAWRFDLATRARISLAKKAPFELAQVRSRFEGRANVSC